MTTFNVGSDAQLRNALNSAQNGDTITLAANITLTDNLPIVQRNVTINGGNFTLSGDNQYRGLFVQSGTVAINNLLITQAVAQGGQGGSAQFGGYGTKEGGGAGGGGAGLGGALFVGSGANVTVSNVALTDNLAHGGNGGQRTSGSTNGTSGGGGGYWPTGADGGNGGSFFNGGGGAGGGGDGSSQQGRPGGFGGGGGGGSSETYGLRGGGGGGFGGGGGGSGDFSQSGAVPGGFGGGDSTARDPFAGGGGGAGLGGAIFVQEGGNLTFAGSSIIEQNTVAGGNGGGRAQAGQGFGSGIFLHGNGSFTVTAGAGLVQVIKDSISDQTGVGGTGGSWSLVKNGAGTTALTGANAYSGGTIVHAGILKGNTSGLQGNIINNSSVVFDQVGSGTYAGNMSGAGTLTKDGTGQVTLTGTNSHSGGTAIIEGTLLFMSDANLGAAGSGITLNDGTIGTASGAPAQTITRPVTITDYGGFSVASHSLTWGGVISGSGPLFKSGNGDLVLSAANTYSGGTTVTGGVLRFTNDDSLGAAGAGITLDGGAVGTTSSTNMGSTFVRAITLAGNGGIDVALQPITWSGNISGPGGLTKLGTGELTLSNANTYTGATTVNGGGLIVDGSIASSSSLTVNAGAMVGGTGTLPSTTVNGGTLSPGVLGTPGILTTGHVLFDQASNFDVELGGAEALQADRLDVVGTVTLSGGPHLNLSQLTGFHPTTGARFTIIDNDGTEAVNGTFSGLPEGASFEVDGQRYTITYQGHAAALGTTGNDVIITASAGRTVSSPTMAIIWGTQREDTLNGTEVDDDIRGWAEDGDRATDLGDELYGFGGRDSLYGGGGGDRLVGGADGDELYGQEGDDRLFGNEDSDWLSGEAGDDYLDGGDSRDLLFGGGGKDYIVGDAGQDFLRGNGGNDLLVGGDDNDDLTGGNGDDALKGDDGDDKLNGGEGNDLLNGGRGADTFIFDRGNDRDRIVYFRDGDTIELESRLGVDSVREALSYATVRDGDTVFRFDTGDVLIVERFTNLDALRDALFIL